MLKTKLVNGTITGELAYNFYQKDKNAGTIHGNMKNDILLAYYTFRSEGVESIRQVAFKKMGANFIEGYGDAETRDGRSTFRNIGSLDFTAGIILKPYDCPN